MDRRGERSVLTTSQLVPVGVIHGRQDTTIQSFWPGLDHVWYTTGMTAKLSSDQTKAVDAHAGQPIKVEHPETQKVYVIVDNETHERAMQALQEQEDHAAIQQGLKEREQGLGKPLAEVDADIREKFGFPPRT